MLDSDELNSSRQRQQKGDFVYKENIGSQRNYFVPRNEIPRDCNILLINAEQTIRYIVRSNVTVTDQIAARYSFVVRLARTDDHTLTTSCFLGL